MKKIFLLCTLLCGLISFSYASFPSVESTPETRSKKVQQNAAARKVIMQQLSTNVIEQRLGRKLRFREKMALKVYKWKFKHANLGPETKGSKAGKSSFALGIAGVGLFVLGLFVPYVIIGSLVAAILAVVIGSPAYKADPSDKKAHSGKLMGWITIGLIALIFIVAAIVVSSWGI
jgi:hypothetical protein